MKLEKQKSMLILNELQKIRELLEKGFPSPTSDGFGNAFEVFALSVIHNLDYDECITNHIVLGSNDGKTDAVYWTSNEVYLYQIKLNDLIETDLDIMRSNYGHFINTGDIPGQDVSDLKNFYIKNKLNISGVKKIEVCSVSKNGRNKKNRKPLDIYREYFEFQILPQEKNSLNLELYIPSVNEEDYPERRLNNMAYIKGLEYFFFMGARELIDSIRKTQGLDGGEKIHKLFYDNVRGKLPANKTMEKTIKNEPSFFSLYNNGVSITGEVKYENGSVISIKDPIIVNGQQTITNLIRTTESIDKIYVPVFIKNTSDLSKKRSIALYNNTQSPIKPLDLLSLNDGVRKIQKELIGKSLVQAEINENSYYLNIYSSGNTSFIGTAEKIFTIDRVIELRDFIKVYFSSKQPNKLGAWKNSLSKQINHIVENEHNNLEFDHNHSVMVCHAIKIYKELLNNTNGKEAKSRLKVADLAIQFLLIKTNLDLEKTMEIKEAIDKEFLEKPENQNANLANLYRSNAIITIINRHLTA